MFQSLDLLALSFLLLMVKSQQDAVLPPQNVSLRWIHDFRPEWSWAQPQHSMENCKYEIEAKNAKKGDELMLETSNTSWDIHIAMEGGYLGFWIKTVCNGNSSTTVEMETINAELVKNFQCYIYSAKQSHCSWLPGSHAPDLKFYYQLLNEDFTVPANDKSPPHLKECSEYNYTGGVKTGCDLEADVNQSINILINGTHNNSLARNTFHRLLREYVKPPALQWKVTKTGGQFFISWTPGIGGNWEYTINYTECVETKIKQVGSEETSTVLNLVPHCQYSIAIQAKRGKVKTPWSDVKYFDAETDPNAWLYAAIIIPLTFAGLAVLVFVCYRKNREHIFPKVPEPRDLISDIFNNNNKSTVCNLYIPAEEEDNCKITLVEEPQINKLD